MPAGLILCVTLVVAAGDVNQDGLIGGVVVNQSRNDQPVAGARVVLEMRSDGDFVLLDEMTTDTAGRYLFGNLLVSEHLQYRPSAQFEGIHYPGPRIQLAGTRDAAGATLAVRDVVHEPNPLLVRNHRIQIRPATGLLEVTEWLTIENPRPQTYVGTAPASAEDVPATLQLSIPRDFQKVTFHTEFFGRSFAVHDGKLVTSLPWEPGQRELAFTYFLHNTSEQMRWERTLDLPTEQLQMSVETSAPDEVSSNLERVTTNQHGDYSEILFKSGATRLPAQHVLHCTMGALPVPWTTYGKWCAVVALLALIICGGITRRRHRTASAPPTAPAPITRESKKNPDGPRQHKKRLRRAA